MNVFEFKPVGQGLFYTGSLVDGNYNFVFDCGTDSGDNYVNKCVDGYTSSRCTVNNVKPKIDFAVLSHLHKDHFNGFYRLVTKNNIAKIYLPYLGDDANLIRLTLAYSIFGNQRISQENMEGAYETYYLMGALYGVEDNRYSEYRGAVEYLTGENSEVIGRVGEFIITQKSQTIACGDNKFWQFAFIQKSITPKKSQELKNALYNKLGAANAQIVFDYITGSVFNARKIKKIYESVFGKGNELNDTSIMLAHFPLYGGAETVCPDKCAVTRFSALTRDKWQRTYFYEYPWCNAVNWSKNCVTLLTGDGTFDDYIARTLNNCIGDRKICVLQVPHHGAMENWQSVVNYNISAENYVVPFGYGNNHFHPRRCVMDCLIANGLRYYFVTQDTPFAYCIE